MWYFKVELKFVRYVEAEEEGGEIFRSSAFVSHGMDW